MGKIQKALEKVQSERARLTGKNPGQAQDASEASIVARLKVDREYESNQTTEFKPGAEKTLIVNRESLQEAGLIAPEADEETLAKQYQDIKRPLIAHAFGKRATKTDDGNIIMVTSSMAGEGKTFTSINLALSMSQEKDHTVILVDADVAKPRTSEMFGAGDQPGLLDLLEKPGLRLASVILRTDIRGLQILPAGRPRPNATELLASSRMEAIVYELASLQSGGIVLLDSPPLLQTSEAKVLATLAGQIVLVVKAEGTSRDAVMAALAVLDGDRPTNLVLNQAHVKHHSHSYSYGQRHHYKGERNTASAVPEGKDMWGA